jgi:hypothetical protein
MTKIDLICAKFEKKNGMFHDPAGNGASKWIRKQLEKIRTELQELCDKSENEQMRIILEDYFK